MTSLTEKLFLQYTLRDTPRSVDNFVLNSAVDIAHTTQEVTPLTDTASEVRRVTRTPSQCQFTPVGHVALDVHPPDQDEKLGLPRSGVVWLHQLYISYALQKGGLGVAAMSKAEHLATLDPFNASIMALDTLAKEMQMDDSIQKIVYDDRGVPRPLVSLLIPVADK